MQLSDRTATILMSRTPNENFVLVQECRRQKPEVRINGQESTLPFRLLIPSPLRRISRARPSPCYYNILSAVPSNPAAKPGDSHSFYRSGFSLCRAGGILFHRVALLNEPRYNGCNRKCESPEVPLPSGADALFWSAATCRRNGPGGRRKPATHRRTPYRTPPAAETDSHFLRPGGVIGSASQFPSQP